MIVRSLCAMVLAGAAVAGCTEPFRAREEYSFTVDWKNYQRVVIHTVNGSVQVKADAPAGKVAISGRKFACGQTLDEAKKNVKLIQIVAEPDPSDPRTLRIESRIPKVLRRKSPGASFHVRVPERCQVEVVSANGSIDCDGVGPLDLTTSNGPVRVHNAIGPVEIATSNGAVMLEDIVGDCNAATANGLVVVRGVRGSLDVATSNGRIEADLTPPADGHANLETSNGSVTATLPASLAGSLRAETSFGTVQLDAGPARVSYLTKERDNLEAKLNGGGTVRVSIETSSGSINIRVR